MSGAVLAQLIAQGAERGADLSTLRAIAEEAGELGATRALTRLGLADEGATRDVAELRELLAAWRDAKRSAWKSVLGWVAALLLGAIAVKLGFGGVAEVRVASEAPTLQGRGWGWGSAAGGLPEDRPHPNPSPEGEGLTFRGYAAVFDVVDRAGDVFRAGAFAEALPVPLLWQHQGRPVGRVLTLGEDARGLWVEAAVHDAAVARMVRSGALAGLSVGYRAIAARQGAWREIVAAQLIEVSLVAQAMQPAARVETVFEN